MTDCFNQVKTFKPETPRNADDALASSFIAGVAYALMQKYENDRKIANSIFWRYARDGSEF